MARSEIALLAYFALVVLFVVGMLTYTSFARRCVAEGDVVISHNGGCDDPKVPVEGDYGPALVGT
jgi:hypothetical protein